MVREPNGRARIFQAIEELIESRLAPDGLIVFHVPRGLLNERSFPNELDVAERTYGSNALWYLSAADATEAEGPVAEAEPGAEPGAEAANSTSPPDPPSAAEEAAS